MPIPTNIKREHLIKAIEKIDQEGIPTHADSSYYDVSFNGKNYPPKLIVSYANLYANGEVLERTSFPGGKGTECFNLLEQNGLEIIPKQRQNLNSPINFSYKIFVESCNRSFLRIHESIALRFIGSLITKRFVILTGLSGSGKSKIAVAYAKWITNSNLSFNRPALTIGEVVRSNRVNYLVESTDHIAVTFVQEESGTKVTLPYELISEWIEAILKNDFTIETSPRTIRETVEKTTQYSTQLNSFETHLKAAAFHLLDKEQSITKSLVSPVQLIPVGADWTNREPLIGYPNALEKNRYVKPDSGALSLILEAAKTENQNRPYFLILDEMNLSHVERYFADFLSAMESGEPIPLHNGNGNWDDVPPSITLPKNLFIIGTVNIDETTYMFSPKVLDRANVIEFRVTEEEMDSYLSQNKTLNLDELEGQGASMAASFVELANDKSLQPTDSDELKTELLKFFAELKKTGAEFGYRSASEIYRFVSVVNRLDSSWTLTQIIDAAVMQKLLPKVHGSRRKLEPVLKALGGLCLNNTEDFDNYIKNGVANNGVKYCVSLEKISRMYNALLQNGFTSYAEA
jgi:5-methylcytosine-specific restriction protein B